MILIISVPNKKRPSLFVKDGFFCMCLLMSPIRGFLLLNPGMNGIFAGTIRSQIIVAMTSSINEDWVYLKNRILYLWLPGRIAL